MKLAVYNIRHCNAPSDAVYIGRGSPYENPFVIGRDGDRNEVCDKFERMVEKNRRLKRKFIIELSGKSLVCHCMSLRCHGKYLLRIANQ